MQILSSTTDHVSNAVTVVISYNVKGPFGDSTETNSFQLPDALSAAVVAGTMTLAQATQAHLNAIGFVEVAP